MMLPSRRPPGRELRAPLLRGAARPTGSPTLEVLVKLLILLAVLVAIAWFGPAPVTHAEGEI